MRRRLGVWGAPLWAERPAQVPGQGQVWGPEDSDCACAAGGDRRCVQEVGVVASWSLISQGKL